MRRILSHRGLRLIFIANMISMIGSGLSSAAVTWHVLEQTGSELNLAYIVILQSLPALLLVPFSGVIIDRSDRRWLVMTLDAGRGLFVLAIAILAMRGRAELWHLYLMATLVALGFWVFWPTITALVQELTPESEFVHANSFLLAGVQGGWLIAGAVVGFLYNRLGLGPILLIDVATYAASFTLYLFVRKGHVVIARSAPPPHAEGPIAHFWHELKEGVHYLRLNPSVIGMGLCWSLFVGGMMTQGVVTAPLSERILEEGAVGYGWLNGGWGVGAFVSTLYTAKMIGWIGPRVAAAVGMAGMALGMFLSPVSGALWAAVALFFLMGSARGVGGVSLSSGMMHAVPKHFMGRVQNTFYYAGLVLQLLLSYVVGLVAQRVSLTLAFAIIGVVYVAASGLAFLPWPEAKPAAQEA